jgi:hypothetical protein
MIWSSFRRKNLRFFFSPKCPDFLCFDFHDICLYCCLRLDRNFVFMYSESWILYSLNLHVRWFCAHFCHSHQNVHKNISLKYIYIYLFIPVFKLSIKGPVRIIFITFNWKQGKKSYYSVTVACLLVCLLLDQFKIVAAK